MHLYVNKKIILYIIFLFLFATINNNSLKSTSFYKIKILEISGFEKKNYLDFKEKIKSLNDGNIFLLKKDNFNILMDSYNMIENVYVFKKYPSTLKIKIKNTQLLANTIIDGNFFLLGSNGKFINSNKINDELPNVFGKFSYKNFFRIKEKIDQSNIAYENIKNLFFLPSGRWDIEFKNGILLKLPSKNVNEALDNSFKILNSNSFKKIKIIDLRILNQIIVNE